ncbi:Alpha/Beta hydrolase protein [Corynascus novoguineensis]|uniref:Alpha/Beta hydrolase protein n=1 Tax=Corynascus novoguineensis TaxID=1126955 RepID=A0AAN7D053_9PEZI|nr:Alpha/Beta hydrolase protein [Corynascus novoguineensis]
MKGLIAYLSLASVALGAPRLRKRQDAITDDQLNDLKLYAQWSAASYCNGEQEANQPVICNANTCSMFSSHNATVVSSFIGSLSDIRGFIGLDPVDKQIVVSFRGSSSIQNWITDFIFTQVPCDLTSGCLAHTGFLGAWNEVADRVFDGVKAARDANPDYKIVVTGHSLGGAVATIAAAYLRKDGYETDLYTYGSPRVGNHAFVDFVTLQSGGEYRVTHADDPVPRLPPILLNYRHTSPEYWIDPDNKESVTLEEVKFCTGYSNIQCNGGTLGLNADSHGWYFQSLSSCGDATALLAAADLDDEEVKNRINLFAELDTQLASNLHAEGQS